MTSDSAASLPQTLRRIAAAGLGHENAAVLRSAAAALERQERLIKEMSDEAQEDAIARQAYSDRAERAERQLAEKRILIMKAETHIRDLMFDLEMSPNGIDAATEYLRHASPQGAPQPQTTTVQEEPTDGY